MNHYLSLGLGQHSTAALLLMLDWGLKFEAVYCDHGADGPETAAYLQMLLAKGYQITILKVRNKHGQGLYEYCLEGGRLPSPRKNDSAWCRNDFKSRPFDRYITRPAQVFIGYDCDEMVRVAHKKPPKPGRWDVYPLIDVGHWEGKHIDREECKRIIAAHGLPVPKKSGCFFCPNQTRREIELLRDEHPDLYCKTKQMEDAAVARRLAEGKKPYYLFRKDYPIDLYVRAGEDKMHGLRKPCECSL